MKSLALLTLTVLLLLLFPLAASASDSVTLDSPLPGPDPVDTAESSMDSLVPYFGLTPLVLAIAWALTRGGVKYDEDKVRLAVGALAFVIVRAIPDSATRDLVFDLLREGAKMALALAALVLGGNAGISIDLSGNDVEGND